MSVDNKRMYVDNRRMYVDITPVYAYPHPSSACTRASNESEPQETTRVWREALQWRVAQLHYRLSHCFMIVSGLCTSRKQFFHRE